MAAEILTTDDLREFKIELLDEIKQLLHSPQQPKSKKWLKSYEVKEMLGISSGTLQNLRVNGTLPFSKIGGVILYDYEDILNVINQNRVHHRY